VAGVGPVLVQMWQGASPVPLQMWRIEPTKSKLLEAGILGQRRTVFSSLAGLVAN
jgi:hypothetical protein